MVRPTMPRAASRRLADAAAAEATAMRVPVTVVIVDAAVAALGFQPAVPGPALPRPLIAGRIHWRWRPWCAA